MIVSTLSRGAIFNGAFRERELRRDSTRSRSIFIHRTGAERFVDASRTQRGMKGTLDKIFRKPRGDRSGGSLGQDTFSSGRGPVLWTLECTVVRCLIETLSVWIVGLMHMCIEISEGLQTVFHPRIISNNLNLPGLTACYPFLSFSESPIHKHERFRGTEATQLGTTRKKNPDAFAVYTRPCYRGRGKVTEPCQKLRPR